jgi:hypothetical protein
VKWRLLLANAGLLLFMTVGSRSQSAQPYLDKKSFLDQRGCPLKGIASSGSALELKNTSNQRIDSFILACLVRERGAYTVVETYNSEEGSTEPGQFTFEGGMDATPLNRCRRWRGVVAVHIVKFHEATSWTSPLVESAKKKIVAGVWFTALLDTRGQNFLLSRTIPATYHTRPFLYHETQA